MDTKIDKIKEFMNLYGYTERKLTEELKVNRTTFRGLMEHGPDTATRADLAEKIEKFFNSKQRTKAPESSAGIPVIGEIPAGQLEFQEAEVSFTNRIASELDPAKYYALNVHGDSMEPEIRDGDVVICRRVDGVGMPIKSDGPTPKRNLSRYDGKLVCAAVDGETTLKRLVLTAAPGENLDYTVVLQPLNASKHKSIVVGKNNTFEIQGEVIRVIREM